MNLENILLYQKTDIELRRLQRSIEGGEQGKTLLKHKREFAAAKAGLESAEAAAAEIVARYNETSAAVADAVSRAEKLTADLESAEEEQEQELLAVLESLAARLIDLERRVMELRKKSERAVADYAEAQKKGRFHKEAYGKAKTVYDEHAAKYEDTITELKATLAELRKKSEKPLLDIYDQLAGERIFPAFAPVRTVDKSYVCGGCGMHLAGAARADLDKDGRCRCESCRRVVYKQ